MRRAKLRPAACANVTAAASSAVAPGVGHEVGVAKGAVICLHAACHLALADDLACATPYQLWAAKRLEVCTIVITIMM